MQSVVDQTVIQNSVVGGLMARLLVDDLSWGEGAIGPRAEYATAADQQKLMEAVLASLEPVQESEIPYSSCTDGRLPVTLLSGEAVPVREQMVGADTVSAFFVAEVLGASFYKDPAAPVAERVADITRFLQENGLRPSSHVGCGAAAGFVAISENLARFGREVRFTTRLQELLPDGVYRQETLDRLLADTQTRLQASRYKGLSAQTFLDAVEQISGRYAIAELRDDGRGVHGHVEEAIVRVQVPGLAINEAKVAQLTGDREVFGINDARLDKLANLFGRGQDSDYRLARLALEVFASASHGTLAQNLSTWVITRAAG